MEEEEKRGLVVVCEELLVDGKVIGKGSRGRCEGEPANEVEGGSLVDVFVWVVLVGCTSPAKVCILHCCNREWNQLASITTSPSGVSSSLHSNACSMVISRPCWDPSIAPTIGPCCFLRECLVI